MLGLFELVFGWFIWCCIMGVVSCLGVGLFIMCGDFGSLILVMVGLVFMGNWLKLGVFGLFWGIGCLFIF